MADTTASWSVSEAPKDPAAALALESDLIFPHFTTHDALTLGLLLHAHLSSSAPKPCLISISLGTHLAPPHILFQAATRAGTTADNEVWVSRKRATVARWGCSTWAMRCKYGFEADAEEGFRRKMGLSEGAVAGYAIHGGGVPVRVRGVEGVVGIVVVSGLKQEEDHMVVVEAMREYIEGLKEGEHEEE